MRISARWVACDDGVSRPVLEGRILGARDQPHIEQFLIDTGADRSVFSAGALSKLSLPFEEPTASKIVGIGGASNFVLIQTVIELVADGRAPVRLRGEFAAFTDPGAIDLCVLGRDILNHFDVIISRRNDEALLLAPNHRYAILPG